MGYDFDKHELSFASGPKDAHLHLAIGPQFLSEDLNGDGEEEQTVAFHDVTHQRAFDVAKLLRNDKDRLEWRDPQGRRFRLQPLTLALYRKRVRPLLEGKPDFRNLSDLQTYFLDTIWASGLVG